MDDDKAVQIEVKLRGADGSLKGCAIFFTDEFVKSAMHPNLIIERSLDDLKNRIIRTLGLEENGSELLREGSSTQTEEG